MNIDRKIQLDVLNELSADPSVNAKHIGVAVNTCVVTLTGHVDSFYEKWKAEKAAQRVAGVQGLVVEIEVLVPGDRQRTDEDIARSVQMVLGLNAALPKDAIKVMVEKGWVTLRGELAWNFQREIAHKAVVGLSGVRGISDDIALKPVVSGANIKVRIEEALKRQASLDAQKISVKVSGNRVTLDGAVSNWTERNVIRHVVWATGGVQFLADNMRYEGPHSLNPSQTPVL
jgi:osmotically-inducible protein OsmY